jgi:protein-S-isoprenylcysteine O-methyltransferase Ste14
VPHLPAAVAVCAQATAVIWFLLEVRQVRNVRREARTVDRGSVLVLRLSAVAGFAAALALAAAVPAAAIPVAVAGWVGLGAMWCGIALRVWSFRTLGRYFTFTVQTSGDQPVVTRGPYRLLRHPGYAGMLLVVLGLGDVLIDNWLSLLVLAAAMAVGLGYRISVEERALLRDLGEDYRRYAATHKRLIPFVW